MTLSAGLSAEANDEEFTPFDPIAARQEQEKARIAELIRFRESDKGKKLTAWVRSAHQGCKNDRVQEERQWALNIARYKGRNDLALIPNDPRIPAHLRGRIGRKPENSTSRKHINRVRPMVRVEMARLMSQKPSAYVVPATSNDDDLFAAQAGEQAWESIQDRRKIRVQFGKAAFWISVTGIGFMKTWWDPKAYDPDSQLNGDIMFGAPSPFHIFVPDKMEQDIEDQPYVIHAYAKPLEWARLKYAAELAGEQLEATNARSDAIAENSVFGVSDNASKELDSVVIYEAWVKPGSISLLPEGGLLTVINNILVNFTEGLPYAHNQYPFTKFEHLPTDTFYSESVINDVAPLQVEYNQLRSRIAESIDKMSSLQYMAPQGSIVPQKMTNETGQVVLYKPGLGKPEPFPIQQLPGYIPQALDRVLLDMEDISGQHQVSKGNVPTGVTAATAISYLQEKDDSYLTHTYLSVEQGFEKMGRQALTLAVQYWDEPRMVKVVGEDSAFDALLLRKSDLENGVDLRTEGGSALPQSKSAKQALIMDLMSQGFVDPTEGLKMMEIGGSQKIVDQLRVDERQAQRENLKLRTLTPELINQFNVQWTEQFQQIQMQMGDPSAGNPLSGEGAGGLSAEPPPVIPVNTWDNHEVHIEIHNRFRKSQSFESLPPEVKDQFEQHVVAHEQAMITKSIEQFMQQIPSDGTDGQPASDPAAVSPDEGAPPDEGMDQPLPGMEGLS
jgi:hypothetical protein